MANSIKITIWWCTTEISQAQMPGSVVWERERESNELKGKMRTKSMMIQVSNLYWILIGRWKMSLSQAEECKHFWLEVRNWSIYLMVVCHVNIETNISFSEAKEYASGCYFLHVEGRWYGVQHSTSAIKNNIITQNYFSSLI